MMSGVVLMPAMRQLDLLRSGDVSVVELAEAHIRQIERLNPKLNAFADFDADRVRVQAREMDETRSPRGALLRIAGDGEVVDCHRGLRARLAVCCIKVTCRVRMRWWWRGCARRAR